MEKTLTRLKSNLKSRRKLSLPMLAGHFPWHQQATGVGVGTYFATQKELPPERATVGSGTLGFRVSVP